MTETASGRLEATEAPASGHPRRPAALLWWSVGLFAAFAAMGLIVAQNVDAPFTQGFDDWWRSIVGAAPDGGAHTWALPMFFQHLGGMWGGLVTLILLPAAFAIIGRWRSALFLVTIGLAGPGLVSQLTKNLVNRPRPAVDEALGLFGPLYSVDHGSFPSGHAMSAAIAAIGIGALIPSARRTARTIWWFVAAGIMLGMVWQRTLVNAHWASDAIFGIVGGVATVLLVWWAFWPLLQEDYGRPVWFLHRGQRTEIAT